MTERRYYTQQTSCQIPDLWFLLATFLGERETGTFVEIGAHDGVYVSNSWGLAERGWAGVMVEPIPALAELCRANHRHHPAVRVIESAVGGPGTSTLTMTNAGALSTARPDLLNEYLRQSWLREHDIVSTIEVRCITLDELLSQMTLETATAIDLLIIDVEGSEAEVLAGFDLARWKPSMLIIELSNVHPELTVTGPADAALEQQILSHGYRTVQKDRINTVFVHDELWLRTYGLPENSGSTVSAE